MNFRLILLSASLATIALTGCDIIKGPKKDYDQLQSNTSQKVLLEDFTGQTCGNCPAAHQAATDLLDVYGDKLIVVAIHAGGFAEPKPGLGYYADFRTPIGSDLENYWNVDGAGFPKGMINRRTFGGNTLLNFSAWGGYIASTLAEEPKVGIDLAATYNESSGIVDVTADVEYYEGGNFTHNLVVIVTEDSVVSRQLDYRVTPPDVDDYYHRHMLRGSLTEGSWGTSLTTGPVSVGAAFNRDFSYTLDSAWDWHHCSIVAYVMDASTKEVLQAEEVHLHE